MFSVIKKGGVLHAINIIYGGLFKGCIGAVAAKRLCTLYRCGGSFKREKNVCKPGGKGTV